MIRLGAACALAACAVHAALPEALTDPARYLHADTNQLTPRRLAEWQRGAISQLGNIWVGLGSTDSDYDAVERAVLNLDLASRVALHAELRNDRDPDGRVTRAVADILVNVVPGLWLGASGVPATRKQDYGVGGSVLLADPARRRFLLVRLVADQFLYDRTNEQGGRRNGPIFHAQLQGRWEEGPWSLWGWLDATTDSETAFPAAASISSRAESRREFSLHARYAADSFDADAGVDLLRLHEARTQLGARSSLLQTTAALRLEALLPPVMGTRWRPRLGVRAIGGDARGEDADLPYEVRRLEPGARVGAQRVDGDVLWELGYAFAVPVLRQTSGGAEERLSPYQDELYGSCEVSFGRIHLRALLGWEARRGRLGGNGDILVQF